MKEGIVAGVGLLVKDTTLLLPKYPAENDKINASRSIEEIGGPVPIALMYLSRLGWNVRLAALIGDDSSGKFVKRRLDDENFDTRYIVEQEGRETSYSQIWLSRHSGSRNVATWNGTLETLSPDNIPDDFFNGVKHLHIDGREPEVKSYVAQVARDLGITISYDAGTYKVGGETLLDKVDIVFASRRFLADWQGIDDMAEASRRLKEFGPVMAIVTDGENGLAYTDQGGTFYHKAYAVEPVLDTNGAGDVFCGAYIHATLLDKSVEDCISFASAAAALKCMTLGKRNLPSEAEVLEFIGD